MPSAAGGSSVLVALTGATGFIGRHLARRLDAGGIRLRCLVRPSSNCGVLPAAAVPVVSDDLRVASRLDQLVAGADAVVHLAGMTRSWSERHMHAANCGGTTALLAAAQRAHARNRFQQVMLISSQAAVGPSNDCRPLAEDAVPRPLTSYGRSKLAAEQARRRFPALPVTVVRPPAVYGPQDTDLFAYFRMVHGGLLPVLTPASRLSLVAVDNLIDAICTMLHHPSANQRVFHVADDGAHTMARVGSWIAAALGKRPLRIGVPVPLLRAAGLPLAAYVRLTRRTLLLDRDKLLEIAQRAWLLDTHRLGAELGWRPRVGTRDAISATAKWYVDAGWLATLEEGRIPSRSHD